MIQRSRSELALWCALALAGGIATGWYDLGARAVQAPALILMLVTFVLTLAGRAPVVPVALLAGAGIPLMHALQAHDLTPGFVIVIIPAFIGALGGKFAGRLLESATADLATPALPSDAPGGQRPLSTRALLALGLIAIGCAGFPSVNAAQIALAQRAPSWWVALIWEIISFLGWIAITPLILRRRAAAARVSGGGMRLGDALRHVVTVAVLVAIHAAVLLVLSSALFIRMALPLTDSYRIAASVFLPIDLLAYLAIHALAAASDAELVRRENARREAELRATAVEGRLAALRARLNPHFLFNALNSVNVLARAGKTEETSQVVERLTGLLRYVLDDRQAMTSLLAEMDFVRQYLSLQQVRFGARLKYEIAYDEALNDAIVPQLILQPIVENAVEHAVDATLGASTIHVRAARVGDALQLIVDDDGPGPSAGDERSGIGLSSTRERLSAMFADRGSLAMSPGDDGRGTRVAIAIPFATLADGAAA